MPAIGWLRRYRRADLAGDLSGGLIVGVMLVPQGMAYAMLAGLPPVVGLYASFVPLVVYAAFGSSRHLAVGPVAMLSLLVLTNCAPLAEPGSAEFIQLVLLLTLMAGALQFVLGLARMGFLANYLSHGVITGFTAGAAVLIGLSQLKHLLGVPLADQHSAPMLVWEAALRIGEAHTLTLVIGLGGVGVLLLLQRKAPRIPAAMLVVIIATLLVYTLGLDRHGVAIVGEVPHGLPPLVLPGLDAARAVLLVPAALTIVFIGFIESIAVAEHIATRERYRVDPNRELRALGMANLAAAFTSGYVVTGGFSRTAVNYRAGARTPLASFITAGVIALTLLLLTPLFRYLPRAALAAIVIAAVAGLIDVGATRRTFRVKKADGFAIVLTFLLTLGAGPEAGVLGGVGYCLALFIWRSSHPRITELGYVESEGVFRSTARYPEAKTWPGVLLVRIDASLYFANMGFVEQWLRRRLNADQNLRSVILDMSGVNDVDASATETLAELMKDYVAHGVRFALAATKGPVRDLLQRVEWPEDVGEPRNYASIQQALDAVGTEERDKG
jgi:SulP family sulfate permease